jgi:rubrerythrin
LEEVEAMIAMLVAREQDHVHWLQELLAAVNDGRPFTLARDPAHSRSIY